MPMQQKKSGLLNKLGNVLKKAHQEHTNDEVNLGIINLPGGIENGIAQLAGMKIDVFENGDNKGKPYFSAYGIVVEPKDFQGSPVEGLRTSIGPEALCDTPKAGDKGRKTASDHVKWVYNILHMFKVDTNSFDEDDVGGSIETAIAELLERAPYFRFSTWQPPTPTDGARKGQVQRVVHKWAGEVNYTPTDVDAVEDSTASPTSTKPKPSTNGAGAKPPTNRLTGSAQKVAVSSDPAKSNRPSTKKPKPVQVEEEESTEIEGDTPVGAVDETGGDDLDSLAEAADAASVEGADEDVISAANDAKLQLSSIAEDLGLSVKKGSPWDKASSWAEAVQMIRKVQKSKAKEEDSEGGDEEAGEDEAVEDEGPATPKKGDVWSYKPLIIKDGKKVRGKAIQVLIMSVNEANQTATLKNLITDKMVTNSEGKTLAIKFGDLEPA